jgi:phenylalanyl-tRNA synthetase beta subunit
MSELDFRKQLLLNEFKTLSQGKKNDEIIPLLFAINDKKSGITFTKEDCQLVINSMSGQLSEKELRLLPELLSLLNMN